MSSIEDYRRRQRKKVSRFVSKEVLDHFIFNGSTLYQRIEWCTSQLEADDLILNYVKSHERLDDLTRGEKELLKLLKEHLGGINE